MEAHSSNEEEEGSDPIQTLWHEIRDLTLGTTPQIPTLPSPPTPLSFLRRHVSQNKPCLVTNAVPHWPALSLWAHSDSHLLASLSSATVSLHLTPTGRADALAPDPGGGNGSVWFASGDVDRVPFGDAMEMIYSSSRREKGFVAYAQQQNDCFREEYGALSGDCESHIPWASEAFGCLPEAVNLWIGNEFSETSFHKDHYENIYAVVTGEKHFLLLPPTDVHRMYIHDYSAANYRYCKDTGEFTLELEDPVRYVPWSSVDPYPSEKDIEREKAKFPLYFDGPKPFEVTVKAGEILYLPSMWFHHVRQTPDSTGRTIAVNYWYDMQFDIKYAYFNFLQSIPYPLSHDRAIRKMICLGSSSDTSIIDTGDEIGTVFVVDDNSESEGE